LETQNEKGLQVLIGDRSFCSDPFGGWCWPFHCSRRDSHPYERSCTDFAARWNSRPWNFQNQVVLGIFLWL